MKLLKFYILSALLTVMTFSCFAEEYLPFLENGKSWIVVLFGSDLDDIHSYRQVTVNRDVKIAGRDCKEIAITEVDKCWWDEEMFSFVESAFMSETSYAVEEDGNVYSINPITGESYLIFSIREEWENGLFELKDCYEDKGMAMTTTLQNIAGKERRCLWSPFSVQSKVPACVVEGIGPSYDFWHVDFCGSAAYILHSAMLECRMNDEVIMTAEDFAALKAPGTNALPEINTDASPSDAGHPAFDLQGRPVRNPSPGTILITSDHRKILTD